MKESMTASVQSSVSKPAKRAVRPKRDRLFIHTLIVFGLFFLFSLWQLSIDYRSGITGTAQLIEFVGHMLPPAVSTRKTVVVAGVGSLQRAVVGTSLGIVMPLCFSFLSAENLTPHPFVSYVIKGLAALIRAIPALIWVLIFIVAVGMGPFPGILALAFNSLGMLIKVFSQSIEELDEGIFEGLRSTGANWLHVVCQGVVPSVLTAFMSWSVFRLEINFRYATILGMVGAGGIGWELTSAMRMYRLEEAMFIILVIFVMVFTVEMAGNRLKKMINRI